MRNPIPILTMVSHNGETDVDRFRRLQDEERSRLMEFITSPEVRDVLKVLAQDLITELLKTNYRRNA